MKKIAIKILECEEFELESIAKELQSYIIEGDYTISAIKKQILNDEIIELDISMNKKMPDFSDLTEKFDEEVIEYELYKQVDESWEVASLDDLEISRIPKWIFVMVSIALVSYFFVSIFEIFAIYDWYAFKYELSGFWGATLSTVTAFIPIVGSVVAYWSATELWHWSSLGALTFYFFYYLPLVGFIFYLIGIILKAFYEERWYRFWRPEFN